MEEISIILTYIFTSVVLFAIPINYLCIFIKNNPKTFNKYKDPDQFEEYAGVLVFNFFFLVAVFLGLALYGYYLGPSSGIGILITPFAYIYIFVMIIYQVKIIRLPRASNKH